MDEAVGVLYPTDDGYHGPIRAWQAVEPLNDLVVTPGTRYIHRHNGVCYLPPAAERSQGCREGIPNPNGVADSVPTRGRLREQKGRAHIMLGFRRKGMGRSQIARNFATSRRDDRRTEGPACGTR